jgi:hypothetical protein
VNRLEIFQERAEEQQCHKMALNLVLDEAIKELSHQNILQSRPSSPTKSNTQRRRKSTITQSPLKGRSRRSSGPLYEDIVPEQQLLRDLGISIPSDATSSKAYIEVLERAHSDRTAKIAGHAANLQNATESAIGSHLFDANITLQLLRDELLADSSFKAVRLLDDDMQQDVKAFERKVEEMREKIEGVDVQKLHGRNVHKEQLVERWAR